MALSPIETTSNHPLVHTVGLSMMYEFEGIWGK